MVGTPSGFPWDPKDPRAREATWAFGKQEVDTMKP